MLTQEGPSRHQERIRPMEEERVTSGARSRQKFICVPKFRMKPVSCASAVVVQNL